MAPWEDFDSTFSFKRDSNLESKTYDQIVANRRALENVLFVDRLLKALNIDAASRVYPPRTNQALRSLYAQIVSSSSPNHHKQALLYYILRDFRNTSSGDASLQFARRCYLPEKYRLFIEGLWHLDRLEFRRALEYLTQPSLLPTFPDEILYVLATHPKTLKQQQQNPSNENDDDSLATAYYLTVSPPLASPKALNAYFALLCRTHITEAFYFTRKQPSPTSHRDLLEQLILFVLSATKPGEVRAKRAMELINLPFNAEEETWFEGCLLTGKARNLQGAKDTVMMRRVATGRLQDLNCGDLESLGGRKIDGLNWDDLRKNLRASSSGLGSSAAAGVFVGGVDRQ
ncbi:hypothetical protein AJ78_05920 [Emergomyces pasteurianus Ep9510]|uniref:ELYS-like domain-containing protein n=1 Tax=Emergomyces pasteurianus Ep9510 TaxID=1447872 RepID=A0A1J9QBW9_9EURO|nr:hypothetical protein AJ78_05920 [Emergomyces pasteurianus Ep9510]